VRGRLIGELRGFSADIPSSAVREDLIARVAKQLALEPQLVRSWMPTPAPSPGAGNRCQAPAVRRS